jgi:hypothetical protein
MCLCSQHLGHQWVAEGVQATAEVGEYLWAPGPVVYSLASIVAQGQFSRCVAMAVHLQ